MVSEVERSLSRETTALVNALQSFGLEEATPEGIEDDLDGEDEEITVAGKLASSRTVKEEEAAKGGKDEGEVKSKSKSKGKGKGKELSEELGDLNHDKNKKSPPPVTKSIKGLLRHSDHIITLPSEHIDGKESGSSTRVLTSWKMADWAYKREPCPFPTRARGLFTERVDGTEEEYRIVARGYDKFFNVNEVSWTKWEAIPNYSAPPYELTEKSNGCIILIAALSPRHILVTSKHSLGSNVSVSTDCGLSHSQMGELWLERHLDKVGKSKEDLAKALFERNLTAVAELCDDSFEEHVLGYPPELTGLHLHGLNYNTPILNSLPSSEVQAFAKTWGLLPTAFTIFPSVLSVRTYCEKIEAAGGIEEPLPDGKGTRIVPVEGFVVRGRKKDGQPGEPFFWKVKFDHPYLMYREWRELTRKVLSAYPETNVKPSKLRNPQSRLYLWWVDREIQKDFDRFSAWKKGKGIIATREEFLKWMKTDEAKQVAKMLNSKVFEDKEMDKNKDFDKTLIVPVAVQGSGKTALGLALSHLFGWGHTQSDDFIMKKSGPHFIKSVRDLLHKVNVVIADKNNHIRKLRADLVDAAASLRPAHRVRLVALVWPVDSLTHPPDKLHSLLASRIVARGQNHQTLRAGEGHESALWQFFGQHEAFDPAVNKEDGEFHEVIEMDHGWTKREALEHVVDKMSGIVGIDKPTPLQIDLALKFAEEYVPSVKKELTEQEQEKLRAAKRPRYYGVAIEQDLNAFLSPYFEHDSDDHLFSILALKDRIEKSPHVTLVHEVELQSDDEDLKTSRQALWTHYQHLINDAKVEGSKSLDIEVVLGPRIVWDSRAMAIEVSSLSSPERGVLELAAEHRGFHVTVGTTDAAIRPVEGKLLMDAAAEGRKVSELGGEIYVREIQPVKVCGKLRGMR